MGIAVHVFTEIGSDFHRDVIALSPSDKAFKRAMRALRKVLPVADRPGYIELIDPNELAIALWVEVEIRDFCWELTCSKGRRVLAGTPSWSASGPTSRPKYLKYRIAVPGEHICKEVWSGLLVREPLALLTPFRGAPVPSEKDRQRILGHTSQALELARPRSRQLFQTKRGRRRLRLGLASNIREADGIAGHIRARSEIGDTNWQLELAIPAQAL